MISIKVNGQFLELYPSTKINLKLNSPIFAEDNVIPGSYTIPFQIPFGQASEINSIILSHYDVISNTSSKKKIDNVELMFDYVTYKTGQLHIGSFSKTTGDLNINFIFGFSTLVENLKVLEVKELVNEEFVVQNTGIQKAIYLKPTAFASSPYSLVVNGRSYSNTTLSLLVADINADPENNANATYFATGTTPLGETDNFIRLKNGDDGFNPLAELSVLASPNTFIERRKWYVEPYLDDYLDQVRSFVNTYADEVYPDDKIRFPYINNRGLYEDDFTLITDESTGSGFVKFKRYPSVNASDPDGYVKNDPFWGLNNNTPFFIENLNSLQPFVLLRHIIDKIIIALNVNLEGDITETSDFDSLLVYSNQTLDIPLDFIGSQQFIFTKQTFNLKDYVPKIKAVDLLKEFQKLFCAAVYYNEKSGNIRIQSRKHIIENTIYEDITHLAGANPIIEDISSTGIRLEQAQEDKDLATSPQVYETGNFIEDTIPTKISGLDRDILDLAIFTESATGPYVDNSSQEKNFNLRLFFYKGISTNSSGTDYPSASYKGNYSLKWIDGDETEIGMINTFWKNYLHFLKNRKKETRLINFELRHLLAIDFEKKYRIAGINYLINSIDVTLTMQGIEPATVELFTT